MFRTLDGFSAPHITHGFFGRRGGVSTGVFDSMNCSLASNDDRNAIFENRARIAAAMNIDADNLMTAYQIHSPDCVFVDRSCAIENRPRVDALVTDVPGLALGVVTADCGPVLFQARTRNGAPIIGAAHAGWGGALKGVLESTVATLCDHGAELASIRAAVGPCITRNSYEVSAGFEEPFLERDPGDDIFFHGGAKPDKLMFDLPGYIARRLASCGVRNVILSDIDTVANADDYFSYRRACHRGEREFGLQMSVIKIEA
jgi:polyphenol oxidase